MDRLNAAGFPEDFNLREDGVHGNGKVMLINVMTTPQRSDSHKPGSGNLVSVQGVRRFSMVTL